jgi:hypothetical protein
MNKFYKILIATLGGIETTFYLFTPILLAGLWVKVSGLNNWTSYFFYSIGLLSTLFRSIKISGVLK